MTCLVPSTREGLSLVWLGNQPALKLEQLLATRGVHLVCKAKDVGALATQSIELSIDICIVHIDARSISQDVVNQVKSAIAVAPVLLVAYRPDALTDLVFAAMAAGARDIASLPQITDETLSAEAESTLVELIAKMRRMRISTTSTGPDLPMIAMGASTGGPQALVHILNGLPRGQVPIVLAQHNTDVFLAGFAEWLGQSTGHVVQIAEEGVEVSHKYVLVARSHAQPIVTADRQIQYTPLNPANPFHPNIDVLFRSMAQSNRLKARKRRGVAVLLTGMGNDGAEGLLALREAGWVTLAQDAESSVVYGMPRAAAALSAATQIVPLSGMASAITSALTTLHTQDVLTP